MSNKIDCDDATLALAASVVDRAHDLISAGWVKGKMSDGLESEFCIHGGINLAIKEIFGEGHYSDRVARNVSELACMFIVDEAIGQPSKGSLGAWAAGWNDSAERTHEDVLKALDGAARRLWNLSVEQEPVVSAEWAPSKRSETDITTEPAQQFLYASLAN